MTDLFDQNTTIPPLDQSKDYLTELVGEGKKFKTAADLARGKAEADATIASIIKEKDELRADFLRLREEANAQAKLQELVDRLAQQPQIESKAPIAPDLDTKASFDPAEIEDMFSKKIHEHELNKIADQNFQKVQNTLKDKLGTNFQATLQEKMNTLGLTKEDINSLARKSPEAFYNVLGLNNQPQNEYMPPPRSGQRTDNFSPQAPKRTWSYYQNMRKTDPAKYYSPETSVQKLRDAEDLGSAFQDGNFNS